MVLDFVIVYGSCLLDNPKLTDDHTEMHCLIAVVDWTSPQIGIAQAHKACCQLLILIKLQILNWRLIASIAVINIATPAPVEIPKVPS